MSSPTSELLCQLRNNHHLEKLHVQDLTNFPLRFQSNNEKTIILNQIGDQDALDQQVIKKKNENKQRYRRLKQKLSSLCCQNQEKCLIKTNKQVSSSNKARLLTLAIEFQKMTLNQTKDFSALENKLREIQKILDLKWENDLVILKQSRFVPAFSALLKKVPTFHKNQFLQSVKTIELGFKVLRVFCTLASNRDYMITTNQLSTLNSCLNSFISKQQKRLAVQCLNVLLQLLCTKIKADSEQIINVTLQIVFFGQLAKRLRQTIQSCITQDGIFQEQYVIKCLKYLHILYRKCFEKYLERPLYQQSQIPQIFQFHSDSLLTQLYQILPLMLLDKEEGCLKQQELPVCQINITMYILRLINICIHINLQSAQKHIEINEKNHFIQTIRHLFKYSKENVQLSTGNHQLSCIYSEIIDFIGKICCQSPQNRKSIATTNLLQMLYNHPIVYIMDPKLKSLLIPTLCSVMDQSQPNMKKYLSENSAENIINYVLNQKKRYEEIKQIEGQTLKQVEDFQQQLQQQQIGNAKKLNRKQSVSSFHSYTTQCTQNSYKPLTEEDRYTTGLFFLVPYNNWESLVQKLRVLDC